ncbi:MAG: hypothetical protein JST80_06785 [Bdellovibrionales bacterium]|nr:hypothetical protein [Bdellovibrionales bacterium]
MKALNRGLKKILLLGLIAVVNAAQAQADGLSVQFDSTKNFNQTQMDKLNFARRIVQTVINSAEFKSKVLNFTYGGQQTFVQNGGLSNQQIYDLLMTGAERYPNQTASDHTMNFQLELYTPAWYQSNNVLGYTSLSDPVIHINKNFYNRAEVFEIAMNLTHEWCHKMGFDHDYRSTARRPYSVPYAIGYLVRDLGQSLLK